MVGSNITSNSVEGAMGVDPRDQGVVLLEGPPATSMEVFLEGQAGPHPKIMGVGLEVLEKMEAAVASVEVRSLTKYWP